MTQPNEASLFNAPEVERRERISSLLWLVPALILILTFTIYNFGGDIYKKLTKPPEKHIICELTF